MPAVKEQFQATGRRKTSVARVILRPGKGLFTVNGKPVEKFFPEMKLAVVRSPLELVSALGKYDVFPTSPGAELPDRPRLCATAFPVPCSRLTLRCANP